MQKEQEYHILLLKGLKANRNLILLFYNKQKGAVDENNGLDVDFLNTLLSIPVTKRSKFVDGIWDYNEDVLSPARNVQGSHLRINFSLYNNIPKVILIEIKCLFYYWSVFRLPLVEKVGNKKRSNGKLVRKINTLISHFQIGLKFLNSLFEKLRLDGNEFVEFKYEQLSDILEGDWQEAAKDFLCCIAPLRKFFKYLKHPAAKEVLGIDVEVSFDVLEFPERKRISRRERVVFSNEDFGKLVQYSSFRVVEFLEMMGEKIEDTLSLQHYPLHSSEKRLNLSPEIVNDYCILRLKSSGYSDEYVFKCCSVDPKYIDKGLGEIFAQDKLRVLIKSRHEISGIFSVVNEVYYASLFLVGIYTGMRPSELSAIKLGEKCIVNENGIDLICSEVKKGKFDSLNLFDDRWVAIPIVKDAIRCGSILSKLKANDYFFSNMYTVKVGELAKSMSSSSIRKVFNTYFTKILGQKRVKEIKFMPYMLRHTLAYQLYRAELGLPFISFQLKHFVNQFERYTGKGAASSTTLGYGEIAQKMTSGGGSSKKSIAHLAEIERVESVMNPDGTYLGQKGVEHKARLKKAFEGYMAAGYSKAEIYDEMARQGLAIINVGSGFCFGGVEDYDESLPCIGTLRCNPIRCPNAVVGKVNAPKWREVYFSNKALLGKEGYQDRESQILAAMKEAEGVLKLLGEKVEV